MAATGVAPSFGAPGGRGAQFVFAHHCHRRVWGSQSCVPTSAWSAGSANAMTSLRTFANEDGTRSSMMLPAPPGCPAGLA